MNFVLENKLVPGYSRLLIDAFIIKGEIKLAFKQSLLEKEREGEKEKLNEGHKGLEPQFTKALILNTLIT